MYHRFSARLCSTNSCRLHSHSHTMESRQWCWITRSRRDLWRTVLLRRYKQSPLTGSSVACRNLMLTRRTWAWKIKSWTWLLQQTLRNWLWCSCITWSVLLKKYAKSTSFLGELLAKFISRAFKVMKRLGPIGFGTQISFPEDKKVVKIRNTLESFQLYFLSGVVERAKVWDFVHCLA